jgi:hypothetical protein
VELITDGQYELNAYWIYPWMSWVNLLWVLDDLDLSV